MSRINNREIAKDLVQDTFFAALKSMKNFKGEASERTWLVSILKRKIIDYYRKINSKKGQAEINMPLNTNGDESNWLEAKVVDPFDKTAEDKMENEELGEVIYHCLDKLPEKQAQVFKMKSIEGLDTEYVCNELNISASNLWVLIHRARVNMADCLEQNWFNK